MCTVKCRFQSRLAVAACSRQCLKTDNRVDVLVQARTSDENSQRILSRKMAEQNVDNAKSLLFC